MPTLCDLLPDATVVLALEPEELAGIVLEMLNAEPGNAPKGVHPANLTNAATLGAFDPEKRDLVGFAVAEAWNWLIREGMVAPKPGDQFGWYFVTRRGAKLSNRAGVDAHRKANELPRSMLHPQILEACWAPYFRGEYDTAVFKAFRELEIEIRVASELPAHMLGTDLARKAFHEDGPLSDKSAPVSERQALQSIMAGAIGSYKNPHSHRKVALDAVEAAEMLILASHLLKIVDRQFVERIVG
ncbi:TIGR02391 family protein [Burkholderia sp. LMU1-1-1.1]|uniref:TIGR02391 family protein n=1 Tax=Burkholderia sp. LMU1-1-1.1 TaxID=3135266 RepID=UPI0034490D1E